MKPDRDPSDSPPTSGQEASDSLHLRQIHGSLVEVRGLGVLILGPSGVGKSECVIELVRRGQRLVADDVVRLRTSADGKSLVGWSPEHIRHYVEVRGLGLLCVADLFGREATLDECEVSFIVRLAEFKPGPGVSSDKELLEFIRENGATIFHPAGTCKMGVGADAVVDPRLRVHGIAGLRVVDCSIMPTLVSGNTHWPVVMIAEKAAEMILASPIGD